MFGRPNQPTDLCCTICRGAGSFSRCLRWRLPYTTAVRSNCAARVTGYAGPNADALSHTAAVLSDPANPSSGYSRRHSRGIAVSSNAANPPANNCCHVALATRARGPIAGAAHFNPNTHCRAIPFTHIAADSHTGTSLGPAAFRPGVGWPALRTSGRTVPLAGRRIGNSGKNRRNQPVRPRYAG